MEHSMAVKITQEGVVIPRELLGALGECEEVENRLGVVWNRPAIFRSIHDETQN